MPQFSATIPIDILRDNRLSHAARNLYCEIFTDCMAGTPSKTTVKEFAEFYDVSEKQIKRWLSELKKLGYIEQQRISIDGFDTVTNIYALKQGLMGSQHNE